MRYTFILFLFACSSPPEAIGPVPEVEIEILDYNDKVAHVKVTAEGDEVGIQYGVSKDALMARILGKDITLSLIPNKQYFVRAYAENEYGTGYSEIVSFYSVCDTDLQGQIDYITVPISPYVCLPNISGVTTLTKLSNSAYLIGDASFGMYDCAYDDFPATGVVFEIVCGKVAILGDDQYGFTYSWTIMQNNEMGLYIQWENSFGDKANTRLIKAGGWPELWQ